MSQPASCWQQVCIKNYVYSNLVSTLLYEVKVFPTCYYNYYSFIPDSCNRLLNLKTAFVLLFCCVFHLLYHWLHIFQLLFSKYYFFRLRSR